MQIKVFSIPVLGGEAVNEELNAFLRSKKVLQVDQQLVNGPQGALWSFCVKYVEDYSPQNKEKEKVDYKKILDEATFQRFSRLRQIRKKLAQEEDIPAYAIFKDDELAELAKLEELTPESMKSVPGIAEKKVEKFGAYFLEHLKNEKR